MNPASPSGLLSLILMMGGCSTLPPASTSFSPAEVIAFVESTGLNEISGLAASHRNDGIFWTHNDSGAAPELHAINREGKTVATLAITNATARDWEDISSFELNGEPWLLIADVGDNGSIRDDTVLYLLPEPALSLGPNVEKISAPATRTLKFSFEDGPRDCEGVAVCPNTCEILLISKRTEPPVLYTLPLLEKDIDRSQPLVAKRISPLVGVVPPTSIERAIPGRLGQYRSNVTAFDLAPDSSAAVVLTYGNIWLYRRGRFDSWAKALSRQPERIPVRGLPQAEALCFSPDSSELWITTESTRAPIQRYQLKS